jgi:L-lactate dehydrogenase complex protein LldE
VNKPVEVGLFITCLVDTFRPNIGFASLKLLEDAGCKVSLPLAQSCCGLTAWNADDPDDARDLAIAVIKAFEHNDYVVAPSKACARMVSENYPSLFAKDPTWNERAMSFAGKVYEITEFLKTVMKVDHVLENDTNTIVGTDLAPLMDKASRLKKQGSKKQVRHVTELMAGMLDTPGIGEKL